jgi:hypothetical protein
VDWNTFWAKAREIDKRLQEPTTWLAIMGGLAFFGAKINTDMATAITNAGVALAILMAYALPESKS